MSKQIEYIDTGVPYCPKIPNTWEVKRLKFVGKSIIGITYNPTQVTDKENGILVLRSSNIQNGTLSFEDNVYVNAEISDKHLSKEGDILICARNGSAHLVGKSAYIPKEYEGLTFGAFMLMFRSNLGKFMYYVFNSNLFKSQTGLFATSTINQLTSDTINNLFVALPKSKEERETIAKFLDQKTAEIDNLISKKQKLIECLREERLVQIRLLTTKGIEKPQFKNSGIDWIGEIPAEWEVKKLKYVSRKVQTGNTPPTSKDEYYGDEFNWYTPADFSDNLLLENSSRKISFLAVQDEAVRVFPENSVLIVGIGATLGKVGYITSPASSNQQINAIVFSNIEEAKFYANLFYAFKDVVLSKSNASTLAILNQAQTKDFIVPVPVEQELPLIVSEIEALNTRIENAIKKIEQEIELIKEYRTSLINEVVTGKITLN